MARPQAGQASALPSGPRTPLLRPAAAAAATRPPLLVPPLLTSAAAARLLRVVALLLPLAGCRAGGGLCRASDLDGSSLALCLLCCQLLSRDWGVGGHLEGEEVVGQEYAVCRWQAASGGVGNDQREWQGATIQSSNRLHFSQQATAQGEAKRGPPQSRAPCVAPTNPTLRCMARRHDTTPARHPMLRHASSSAATHPCHMCSASPPAADASPLHLAPAQAPLSVAPAEADRWLASAGAVPPLTRTCTGTGAAVQGQQYRGRGDGAEW